MTVIRDSNFKPVHNIGVNLQVDRDLPSASVPDRISHRFTNDPIDRSGGPAVDPLVAKLCAMRRPVNQYGSVCRRIAFQMITDDIVFTREHSLARRDKDGSQKITCRN